MVLTAAGGLLTDVGPWYRELRKPRLQPPDWLFGPAWSIILGLSAWAFVLAWDSAPPGARWSIGAAFAANWVFHLVWSPLFFKLRRPDWALWEVPLLWLSVLGMIVAYAPHVPLAGWLLAPYLGWVSFATWLNWQIVRLNPRPA